VGSIALLLLGTQWYILFNVIAGAMAIPTDLKEATGVFGIKDWNAGENSSCPAFSPTSLRGWLQHPVEPGTRVLLPNIFTLGDRRFGLHDQPGNRQRKSRLARSGNRGHGGDCGHDQPVGLAKTLSVSRIEVSA
jgi:hypothetical protein